MTLALVPRSVRALSDQLNAYYRVLKGSDQDSIFLRLASLGGSFEVRHSATNAAVFKVTDAGVSGIIQGGDIVDGTISNAELGPDAVTTDKILNGTIVNADIDPAAAINGGKIATATISGGPSGQIAPSTIQSSNILDGTIVDADISSSAAIDGAKLANLSIPSGKLGDSIITSAKIQDGAIVDLDVNAAAAIAVTKVAHVGANNVLKSNGTTANVGGQVVNADVAAAAAIVVSKLAGGGTANRVVRTTDGSTMLMGQVATGDIAPLNVSTSHINAGGAGNANTVLRTTDGTNTLFGKVIDADVNAAAALALSKLAPGSAGVLKSNGTVISAGNVIVTNDMVINTINGDRITDNTIPSSKISGGATVPANSIDTTHIIDGSIQTADMQARTVPGAGLISGPITQSGQALATTGSPSTGNSVPTVLAEMQIALTTTGGPVLIWFTGTFFNSTSGTAVVQIYYFLDGVDQGQGHQISVPAANYYITLPFLTLVSPSAAPHTFEIKYSTTAGTVVAYSTWRRFVVAELKR